jgi:hypothetical protein
MFLALTLVLGMVGGILLMVGKDRTEANVEAVRAAAHASVSTLRDTFAKDPLGPPRPPS